MDGSAVAIFEPAAPAVVGEILDIPVARIRTGQRLRELDQTWANALSGILDREGQRTPIEVSVIDGTSDYQLVTGLHRTAARTIGGHTTVRGVIVSGDALERRSREVSENLWRKGLEPLERAAFIAELHEILRIQAGRPEDVSAQSVAARARWESDPKKEAEDASLNVRLAYRFPEEIADQVGLSRAQVYRALQLHRALAPDVASAIRTTEAGRNSAQLQALAKLPPEDQRKVADLITGGKARAVPDAVAQLTGAVKPTAEAKRLSAFVGAFARMSLAEKKAALSTLAELDLPKGWSISHA